MFTSTRWFRFSSLKKKFNQYHRQRQAQVCAETDEWFDWRTLCSLFTVDRRTICTAENSEKKVWNLIETWIVYFLISGWLIFYFTNKPRLECAHARWLCGGRQFRHISCGYFYVFHQDKFENFLRNPVWECASYAGCRLKVKGRLNRKLALIKINRA